MEHKPPIPSPNREVRGCSYKGEYRCIENSMIIIIDWLFRLVKYSLLVCATFSVQHTLFIVAAICVIIASLCDLAAQIILVRREVN